jgi:hypothetical protein
MMNVIPETRRVHLIWYLRFYYHYWLDNSAGGLLVPEGIIRLVVSVSITGSITLLVDY